MPSKFKIRLKIQGFELEVEGSRDEVSDLTRSVSEQLSGLMNPSGIILDGSSEAVVPPPQSAPKLTDRRSRRKKSIPANTDDLGSAIDFRHDPSVNGMPRQDWKTAQKALWLIHILSPLGKGDGFSTKTLVETFNKHFKQAGTITTSNVTRDLGRAKINDNPPPVGEDTTKSPSQWFLTEEGTKRVLAWIAEARQSLA
jgi:hypothetical protein